MTATSRPRRVALALVWSALVLACLVVWCLAIVGAVTVLRL